MVKTRKQFKAANRARLAASMTRTTRKMDQIAHCVSQLRRFSHCFLEKDTSRMLQFGYNLGRLQELCGDTLRHDIWWKPVEKLIDAGQWGKLFKMVDTIGDVLGVEYDPEVLQKGC